MLQQTLLYQNHLFIPKNSCARKFPSISSKTPSASMISNKSTPLRSFFYQPMFLFLSANGWFGSCWWLALLGNPLDYIFLDRFYDAPQNLTSCPWRFASPPQKKGRKSSNHHFSRRLCLMGGVFHESPISSKDLFVSMTYLTSEITNSSTLTSHAFLNKLPIVLRPACPTRNEEVAIHHYRHMSSPAGRAAAKIPRTFLLIGSLNTEEPRLLLGILRRCEKRGL